MDGTYTYSPGENIYHDIIFIILMLIWSFSAFYIFFYGTEKIFKKDFKDHKEYNNGLLINVKYFFYIILMGFVCGVPFLFSFGSFFWIVFYLFVIPFDGNFMASILEYSLFVMFYLVYLFIFMKNVNKKIFTSIKSQLEFMSKMRFNGVFNTMYLEDRESVLNRDKKLAMMLFGGLFNFGVVPITVLVVLRLILGILGL